MKMKLSVANAPRPKKATVTTKNKKKVFSGISLAFSKVTANCGF